MFKKAKGSKLYEEVVRQIRNLISQGKLKAGDLLPSEEELANSIGVSRATVREGLRILELVGLVETQRGKGTMVTMASPEVIQEKLAFAFNDNAQDLLYLMQVREIIEPEIAKIAAMQASDEDKQKMASSLEETENDIKRGGTGDEGSLHFHYAIINSINNPILTYLMSTIIELQRKSRSITLHVSGRPIDSLDEHKRIYEAIKCNKPYEASLLMKEHLHDVRKLLKKIL